MSSVQAPESIDERYELRNATPLGRGAFGGVWLYLDRRLNRLVAIKLILRADVVLPPLEEAQRAANLSHPNIVWVSDVLDVAFETDQTVAPRAFVMEPLTGPSLHKVLAEADGPERARAHAMSWVGQTGSALAHAHGRRNADGQPAGIIHGDLHLGNIVLHHPDGASVPIVKVTDWGTSVLVGAIARGRGNIHTMAPEAVDRAEPASDLWSVGLLLSQLATGRRLARSDLPAGRELALATRALALQLAETISSTATRDLVVRLLDPDPAHRATPADIRQAHQDYLEELRLSGVQGVAIAEYQRAEREAEERAQREAQERAQREAQERAQREAQERAQREAQERAQREAQERAQREAQERAQREAQERAQREAQERAQRGGPAPRHRRRAPRPALLVGALVIGAGAAGALIPQHADDPPLPRGPSTAQLKHLSVRLSPDWPQTERVDLGEAAPVAVVASLPSGSRVTVATIAKYTDLRDPLPAPLRPAGVTPQPWMDNGLPLLKYEGKRDDDEFVYAYVALFADGPEVIACSAPSAAALKSCVRDLATVRSSRPPLSVVLDERLQATVIRELRRVANARRDAQPILRRRYLRDRIGGLTKLVTAYAAAQRNLKALYAATGRSRCRGSTPCRRAPSGAGVAESPDRRARVVADAVQRAP